MKIIFVLIALSFSLFAQEKFPFRDPNLPLEKRLADLVGRMTLDEKIAQLNYKSPAIDRLGIPAYNWWNECLHGVARNGLATVFPQAIGLGAMWDRDMMFRIASAISDEARAKYNDGIARGRRGIYQGLTFWSPNINIFRDPRWGRGMETYGEDPYLTGEMAVQFIKGLQGNDPRYFKTIATAKHFAVHSGPEPDRHTYNARVSEYDLRETYLPAFKKSVQDANVQSIMCAYNSLRGKACCSSDSLLEKILRNEWGFKGYVVSDCWAIGDIYQNHKQAADAAEASAIAVKAGTDLECGASYPELTEAIRRGLVSEGELNISLLRLMEARFRLGMFDPPSQVPFSKIGFDRVHNTDFQSIALEAARKSIVLLKNQDRLLPLKKSISTVAVIGPNAHDEEVILSNYNGTPSSVATPLQGIQKKLGPSKVIYERGCDIAENMPHFDVIPSINLFTSPEKKHHGLKAELFDNPEWKGKPYIERIDQTIDFRWLVPGPDRIFDGNKSIRWSGYLVPDRSGKHLIGSFGFNGYTIFFEDTVILKGKHEHHPNKRSAAVILEKGKAYRIVIDYYNGTSYGQMQLLWSAPEENLEERAVAAAKKSDAVILCMGLSPRLEGEEMKVPVDGFAGGDRLTLDLPAIQQKLIRKIVSLGKPVVLVLLNGSALSINWENENIPAIVEAWYGGEAAGEAIADVLFGDYNPSGRLPVTFYKSVDQLPDFKDYAMRSGVKNYWNGSEAAAYPSPAKGRTYRYFTGDVLYPFGCGLSYSKFDYREVKTSSKKLTADEKIRLSVDVCNTSKTAGEEVVQLYLKGTISTEAIQTLKGFERIFLQPGEAKTVVFEISAEMMKSFREGRGFIAAAGEYEFIIGSSSHDLKSKAVSVAYQP